MNHVAPATAVAFQRTRGEGRISSKHVANGRSRIDRLFQEGAARIRVPDAFDHDHLEAVLINTAGGLTGGDSIKWTVGSGSRSTVLVSTQACEKVYKSTGGSAHVDVRLKVEPHSTLLWLPQETIFFDRARLDRTIRADLADGATLLMLESLIFGRRAMEEVVRSGQWHERWRIYHKDDLIHAENVRLNGEIAEHLDSPAGLDGMTALATLALFGNDVTRAKHAAETALAAHPQVRGGSSAWESGPTPNTGEKLIIRVAALDGYDLRTLLNALIPAIVGLLPNSRLPGLPSVWKT